MYDIITNMDNGNPSSINNSILDSKYLRLFKIKKFIVLNELNFYEKFKKLNKPINKNYFQGVLVKDFDIKKIRENLDKIIFSVFDEECCKYNEIDVVISDEIIGYKSFKEIKANYISYAFNFSELTNVNTINRIKKISIMQKNFKLIKKYHINYIIGSFANNIFKFKPYYSLFSFGKILGMSDEEAKNAITKNYEKIFNKFAKRNSMFYITDGLEIVKFLSEDKEKKFKKKKFGYY